MRTRNRWWWLPFACTLVLACGSRAPSEPAPGRALPDPQAFQTAEAWRHMEALAALGPRGAGTEAAGRARDYVAGELAELGLVSRELAFDVEADGETRELRDLVAEAPGAAGDLLVVVARTDTGDPPALADDGSGAAVALELARLVAAEPLPYTTWFVFHEGGLPGLAALAEELRDRGPAEQVRLALLVDRVCAPDLAVARDLLSHRVYREELFTLARRRGLGEVFDATAPFHTVDAGQPALAGAGLRRLVVLAGAPRDAAEPEPAAELEAEPESGAQPEPAASLDPLASCSPESVEAVGRVAWAGLRSIAARLHRIDRFSAIPVAAPPEPPPPPEANAAPETAPGAETGLEGPPPAEPEAAPDPAATAVPEAGS